MVFGVRYRFEFIVSTKFVSLMTYLISFSISFFICKMGPRFIRIAGGLNEMMGESPAT